MAEMARELCDAGQIGMGLPLLQRAAEATDAKVLQAIVGLARKVARGEAMMKAGSTTTIRKPLGVVRRNARSREFLADLMRETVAVGRAHGVALPEDYAAQRMAFADTLPEDMTSSMHHDLERGNRLEVEWLSGGVVQLGAARYVPTPCNRAVWDILAPHAMGRSA